LSSGATLPWSQLLAIVVIDPTLFLVYRVERLGKDQ
jgi:hypothetical protein